MKSPHELDEEMLEELDKFLMSDDAPEDCLQISELDGFLAGIVVGPELIKPSEWVPCIWMGGEPEFKDMDQAERIMGIIMSRYNEIIFQLKDDPKEYWPIVHTTPDGELIAADWVVGFMEALQLRTKEWDTLLHDKDSQHLMGPILALSHDKDGKPLIDGTEEELAEIRQESAEALPFVMKDIQRYWQGRYNAPAVEEAFFGKKVGRNEPCPCGSGRKYKKCCGSN